MFVGHRCDLADCEKLPDLLNSNRFYYNKADHTAFHLCPCGCGNIVATPIHYEGEPEERRQISFDMQATSDGLVTLRRPILCDKCGGRYRIISSLFEQAY